MFPGRPGEKVPRIAEWQQRSSDDKGQLSAWAQQYEGCNWCLDTEKSGLLVVDLDSEDAVRWFNEQNGGPASTRAVKTPRGGWHIYFKGEGKSTVGKLSDKVDTRGLGGYVMLPGSRTKDGSYTLVLDLPVAPVPAWLTEALGATSVRRPDAAVPLVEYDLPANIGAAVGYLLGAEPAVQGAGGDMLTYQTACKVRDIGISRDKCLELMALHWNDRCSPPWDMTGFDSLETKVLSAYNCAKDQPGNASVTPQLMTMAAQRAALADAPANGWRTLDWFMDQERVPREWIVKDWVPLGPAHPTILTGDPGAGKSLIAVDLACACATGADWMGLPTTRVDASALIVCEDSWDDMVHRMQDLAQSKPEIIGGPVNVMSRVGEDNVLLKSTPDGDIIRTPFWDYLAAQLALLGGPDKTKLLVLDTARDVLAIQENDNGVVSRVIKHHIIALGQEHNATILVVHHPAKVAGSTYAGGVAWQASFRAHMFLTHYDPEAPTNHRRLSRTKSNHSAMGAEMILTWQNGCMIPIDVEAMEEQQDKAVYMHIATEKNVNGRQLSLRGAKDSGIRVDEEKVASPDGKGALPAKDILQAVKRLLGRGLLEDVRNEKFNNGLAVNPWPEINQR